MRKLVTIFMFLPLALSLRAQLPEGYELVDSLVYVCVSDTLSLPDSLLFDDLPGGSRVVQSDALRKAMLEKISVTNPSSTVSGYRIRIYFDNSRNARSESSSALYSFKKNHPDIPAYRTFSNPYFKVTVGDYRTKSEALAALERIRANFPSAFVVKEKVRYPSFEGEIAYRVDTVKVLRRVK